jgi:DNA mismatch repair protein MSH6
MYMKLSLPQAKTRWQAGSLQTTIRSLKEARENRNAAIKAFRLRLFAEFDTDRSIWLRAVRVFAELDCLFSLAKASIAIGEPSCRPVLVEGDGAWVDFKELRHPTLCMNANLKSFIPNDITLGGEAANVALLTGEFCNGRSVSELIFLHRAEHGVSLDFCPLCRVLHSILAIVENLR